MFRRDDFIELVDPVVDLVPPPSFNFVVIRPSSVISLLSIQVRVVTGAVDRPWARPADVDGRSALFHVVVIFLDHKK